MTDVEDPFATAVDEDDPFATPEDVARSSGPFVPRPYLADLAGRLVAMVPREFKADHPKRKDRIEAGGKETEECYIVDMAVLSGGDLTFFYASKVEGKEDEFEQQEHTIPAGEIPFTWFRVFRTEGNVIGQLKKIDGTARPVLLGRVRRGPQAPDKRKGVTADQVEKLWEAYEAHLRAGRTNAVKPKFSWFVDVDVVTDADRTLARQWLTAAKADGFTL
jgi:hypothetical protein